jgi:CDGSH iron-sulfur domain-containing protein 3
LEYSCNVDRKKSGGMNLPNQIKISDDGPLVVSGDFLLSDAEGNEFTKKEKVFLCRCGQSSKKPFCDGTHKKVEFESSPRVTSI